jgi:hypothetical protein
MPTLKHVHPGDKLNIPATAYNAFVDAARDFEARQRNTSQEAQRDIRQNAVVLVRNDSDQDLESHHALAISGVLIEPNSADQERTFQSRTPLIGRVATLASPRLGFVVTQEPIAAGAIGRSVITGITPARVHIYDERDTTCELDPATTVLASAPLGGAPIIWRESGLGEKWALIEIGRPSLARITAILGKAQPIPSESNRWRYPWSEAVLDGQPGSMTYLRYVVMPGGLSSKTGLAEDPARMAINRFEAHHCNEPIPAPGFGGLLGLGPVCDLPGVLPECPPARSLVPRLIPIPQGVCVQLTCERNSVGNPVWVFEAMSLVELVDVQDGERKFNLYIPESAGGSGP